MPEKSLNDREYLSLLKNNFDEVKKEIGKYPERKIILCGATKTVSADIINYCHRVFGLDCIGENRVQELLSKYDDLDRDINIHFIGRLQTNKVKYIVDKVSMIESLDSEKLALEIEKECKKIGKRMDVLIEINTGNEESKGGTDFDGAYRLYEKIKELPHLNYRGIMAVLPKSDLNGDGKEKNIKYFCRTYEIFIDICENKLHNIDGCILSMGMSGDYKEALICNANLIRPGRSLFGER